jgi:hypothetical protein
MRIWDFLRKILDTTVRLFFFPFNLWCKLQIVIYFNKSLSHEVQKVELQSLVPLLVREETDKRRSKRRAFKINPPSKNIRNETNS